MIKLKKILSESAWDRKFGEPLPTLKLEQEEPEHFGGGKNIEIYGYQTENFDICKSAVMLFEKLNEMNLDGMAAKYSAKSAEFLDEVFRIEKEVVKEDSASSEQVESAVDNSVLFGYELGCVGALVKKDFTRDTGFVKMHVMEIVNRKK